MTPKDCNTARSRRKQKFFLKWKEVESDNSGYKLDKYLRKMCEPARLIELMHDFVLFDGGVKKLPRAHQYFGIKAAQRRVEQRSGGIIWHVVEFAQRTNSFLGSMA